MKSRTNAQQELMRQQIIEEERNDQYKKSQNPKISKSNPRILNSLLANDNNICFNKSSAISEVPSKLFISRPVSDLDSQIYKRQRSSSYSVMSNSCLNKVKSFSPATKSPMDLAFSELGNDDALDWNQIEPSITTTSEISLDLLDQITRGQPDTIHEAYTETGAEENDSLQDDQSVSSMKPSTSCPSNITHPMHFTPGQTSNFNQQNRVAQKALLNLTPSPGIVEDHKLQWIRDRNKKDCHNRIERKRRDYINNQIQELGQMLPEKLFLSTESKRNKGGILKNSVIYIQQLQQVLSCLQHLQKEAQISENLISVFYKRSKYLENLLTQSGISFDQNESEKNTLQEWFNIHQNNSVLLQNVNTIQSSWSSDHSHNDKLSNYLTSLDDVTFKNQDVSAENVLNSGPITRVQSSNSGAGGSSSGTQSITNYNSPLNTTSTPSTTNQSTNNNTHLHNNNNIQPLISSNVNIVNVNSPQQRNSPLFGSSQPFNKTGIRLYESSSKSCISDSPVLSSILIGSSVNSSSTRINHEHTSTNRQSHFTGFSNSVPDDSRTGFVLHNESTSGERYYLIPISKSKGIQLMTGDLKNSRDIIKFESNTPNNEDFVINRLKSEISSSPQVTILNSYSMNQDHEVQNCIEISPIHNDQDDSLMGEFEFDDISME